MTCPRCGRRNAALSWYCQGCGSSLFNAVESGARARFRSVWLVLGAVAAAAAVIVVLRSAAARPPAVSRSDHPSPTPLAAAQASAADAAHPRPPAATQSADPARLGTAVPTPPVDSGRLADPLAATVVAAAMGGAAGADPASPPSADRLPGAEPPLIPVHDGAPVWSAAFATEPSRLDGWLNDWPGSPLSLSAVVQGLAAWGGAADLSGEGYVAWTKEDLGIGVHVVDDHFVAPPGGPQLGQGDSVELQLDTDLEGDWTSGTYSADDWQIGLSPGDLAGRAPEVFVWRPGPARALAGARIAARRVADGYTIEALIPWAALGLAPRGLASLGLAVSLADRDAERAGPETVASSSPRRTVSDPRTFGTLVLAGEDGAGLIEAGRPHSVAP